MTPKDMMVIDTNAEELGVLKSSLMENAGRSIAEYIITNSKPCKVVVYAGSGGNGGDGFVATRHLINNGFEVEIFLLTRPELIKSDEALENWKILQNMHSMISPLKINIITDSSEIKKIDGSIIVDALLGTGIQGKIKEPLSSAINLINSFNGLKIAVDVPSGLDPLKGEVYDKAVMADVTITFHQAKKGLKNSDKYVGKLVVCDIGIPKEAEIFTGKGDLLRLKSPSKYSHKGNNGRVLIIGGSKDYSGAPALAGMAALKSGVDIVYIAAPEIVASDIRSYAPDFIVRSFSKNYITIDDVEPIVKMAESVNSVLIGCGLGRDKETITAVRKIISQLKKPLVIDADALHMLDNETIHSMKNNKEQVVFTPHANEFKALTGQKLSDNLEDKIQTIKTFSHDFNAVILLKGVIDVISNGKSFKLNRTGNQGMTVGGTGDCLAGLVAGIMAQGNTPFESAYLAAFINGKAGDLAFKEFGYNFTANELTKFISQIFMKSITQ
ncbi:MAG: NAD(P)H-hydrate dehydratase [Methanobacteriaceae archaeon]|nr:NAD(P)H-hydrate dehydratase [Methanobacteriaceae archaeon]